MNDTSSLTSPSNPLSVAELTRLIKRLLEAGVGQVEVEGEISNWKLAASGHAYFALKDEAALLSCVMFKGQRTRLNFTPAEGMKVIVSGAISVYEQRGQYQLIVAGMREAGLGDLYKRFLKLKENLEKEGLFDPERKRPIPALPKRIGIVTSPTGAALRDILNILNRRFSGADILISPTLVQGPQAPQQIVSALDRLSLLHLADPSQKPVDVIIVARGGGSIEDLWAFNDESVARSIANTQIPIISAVGHETDFTIADFVADLRAPTPSAAAELVIQEAAGLAETLERLQMRIENAILNTVEKKRLALNALMGSWGLRQPIDIVRQAIQRVDELNGRMETCLTSRMNESRHRLDSLSGRLVALDPKAVLARGYSIVTRARDSRVITSNRQVRIGDHVRIQLSTGDLRAQVIPPGEDFFDGTSL